MSSSITHQSKVKIFVLSHDPDLLSLICENKDLSVVNLNDLDLSSRLNGNELAENRFFLSKIDLGSSSSIGCISARWNERFPNYPNVQELGSFVEKLTPTQFLAPQSLVLSRKQFFGWIQNQDLVHPGMSKLLVDLLKGLNLNFDSDEKRTIVMGNNFVCSRDVFEDFLEFWKRGFEHMDRKFGFDLPFTYRCPKCGLVDKNGIGRWGKSRHSAFFYERVTALFFASRPELELIEVKKGALQPKKPDFQSKLMVGGPALYRAAHVPIFLFKRCNHEYTSLGKF